MAMRVVVVGTGTEIGKTFIAGLLCRALAASESVRGLKPIESGYSDPSVSDAQELATAAGHDRVEPCYALVPPISPHLAARQAGLQIELSAVSEWVDQHSGSASWVVVESAGGLLSPISDTLTNIDLAMALRPAVLVVVAANRLGVLHDVAATLTAARSKPGFDGIPQVLVLNELVSRQDASQDTNAEELVRLGWAGSVVSGSKDDESIGQRVAERVRIASLGR